MIVISDNSALSALAEAGLTDLLPRLFGIIGEAADRGWLDFDETIDRIIKTGFHIHQPHGHRAQSDRAWGVELGNTELRTLNIQR